MAFIRYAAKDEIPAKDLVPNDDYILRMHGVHSRVTRFHYDLFKELMYSNGPLTRVQREMIAVTVSATNACHY